MPHCLGALGRSTALIGLLTASIVGCAAEQGPDAAVPAAAPAATPRAVAPPSSASAAPARGSVRAAPVTVRAGAAPASSSAAAPSGDAVAVAAGSLEAAIPYDSIRGCYTAAQEQEPALRGRLEVRVKIGRDGLVSSAQVTAQTGLSGIVVGCVLDRLQATRFPTPDAGHDTLILPIEFEPKP